ncbi:hypothetical protein D3C78_1155820 [compost metagenome]
MSTAPEQNKTKSDRAPESDPQPVLQCSESTEGTLPALTEWIQFQCLPVLLFEKEKPFPAFLFASKFEESGIAAADAASSLLSTE